MNLDFLNEVTLEETSTPAKKTGGNRGIVKNPEGLAIRVFKSGAVYPSQQLVDALALEYNGKDAETGYALDIIDTEYYDTWNGRRVILASPVKKTQGRADLFGRTDYNEDKTPKLSVMAQGASTFGKSDLIPMLKDVYNFEFPEDKNFVDLKFVVNPKTNEPFTTPRTVTYLPKKVSRGENKGKMEAIRREDAKLYVLVIDESTSSEEVEENQPKALAQEAEA